MHKRKGWLFSDAVKGAVASANLFSIVETAKANGVEPHAYLSLLFAQLPYAKTVEDFETLLPWNVKFALTGGASSRAAQQRPISACRGLAE
jgi:IS66 C-terminal element